MALVGACGGNVEGGPGPDAEGSATPPPDNEAPSSSDTGTDNPDADTELGSCKLGRKEDYREPCRWVADRRCYDDREMACNCACPRSHNSQCTSGFDDGPDGHVWVTCD